MNIIETNLTFKPLTKRSKTNRIFIHHAAASNCSAEDIHRWHLNNGWSGAGYHFLVRKNGQVYSLRPEWAVGAHATGDGANYDSIGICFEGNFQTEIMTNVQIRAGKELVTHLKEKYNISKVQAHREVNNTSCPGKNFPFDEIANGKAEPVKGDEEEMKIYQNGSTVEPVYSDTALTNKIGTLNAHEKCDCYGIFENRAVVRYKVDGKNIYKVGFCKWLGGVK